MRRASAAFTFSRVFSRSASLARTLSNAARIRHRIRVELVTAATGAGADRLKSGGARSAPVGVWVNDRELEQPALREQPGNGVGLEQRGDRLPVIPVERNSLGEGAALRIESLGGDRTSGAGGGVPAAGASGGGRGGQTRGDQQRSGGGKGEFSRFFHTGHLTFFRVVHPEYG